MTEEKTKSLEAVLTGLVTFLNIGAMIIARGVIFPPEERPPGVKLVPEGMILRSTYPTLPIFHVSINNRTALVLYSIILYLKSSLSWSLQSSIIRCHTASIYLTHISCLYPHLHRQGCDGPSSPSDAILQAFIHARSITSND